jgi:hypothetical protein
LAEPARRPAGFFSGGLKFYALLPIGDRMNTKVTKAQAAAILKAATDLLDLICDVKEINELSPEWGHLHDRIVQGALAEVMPDATLEVLFELLDKPEVGH